jgi:hypothetical protein
VSFENNIGTCQKALAVEDDCYFACLGLMLIAVGWCDSNLTDGMIPRKALPAITLGLPSAELVEQLVSVGWWHEVKGGWQIHDYTDWQRSADEIRAKSDAARKAALSRWSNAGGNAKRNAECNTEGNAPTDRPIVPTEVHSARDVSPPKLGNLPGCMTSDEWSANGGPFLSSAGHILRAIESKWGIIAPTKSALIAAAISDTCPEGCKCESSVTCCQLALDKIAKAHTPETAAKFIRSDRGGSV